MRKLLNGFKNQKGFTLIELLVVVAILGVLAAVVVPNLTTFMDKGDAVAIQANVSEIQAAADAYAIENGDYPTNETLQADTAPYLREWPTIGEYTITADGKVEGKAEGN